VGRRGVARDCTRGGEHIPPLRRIGSRLATALTALASLGGVAVYAAIGVDGLPKIVPVVAAAAWVVAALGIAGRWPEVLSLGLAGVGGAYALSLAIGRDDVDPRAPIVAAAVLLAAELGFWSLEPRDARADRMVIVRRLLHVAGAVLGAALLASLLLVAAADVSGGVMLVALGVLAAVATISVMAALAARLRA
jgi:hypothetical protein